jgi:hypothetical protein
MASHVRQDGRSKEKTNDIKWGKPIVPLGAPGVAALGTIGGSGPSQPMQSGWLRGVDTDGKPFLSQSGDEVTDTYEHGVAADATFKGYCADSCNFIREGRHSLERRRWRTSFRSTIY